MCDRHESTEDRLVTLPLFPLGTVLFPGMGLPLHIFEERYRRLIRQRRGTDPMFGIVLTREGREVGDQPKIHPVGTAASLLGLREYDDGRFDIAVRGGRRFRVVEQDWSAGFLTGQVTWLPELVGNPVDAARAAERATHAYAAFLRAFTRATGMEIPPANSEATDPVTLSHMLAARLPVNTWESQRLLDQATAAERLALLTEILGRERRLLAATGAGGAIPVHPGARFSPN